MPTPSAACSTSARWASPSPSCAASSGWKAPCARPAARAARVGRPNVGKSALFNRLAGTRRALVHDKPGMTRDALEMEAKSSTGRPFTLVDTGGLDLDAAEGFAALTSERAMSAVGDADVLVLV